MSELLTGIGPALIALGPFGIALLVVLVLVGFLLAFRKNRFEEDKNLAAYKTESIDGLRQELEEERTRRRAEEKRSNRLMDALRIWCGFAHGQWHERMTDRQMHISHEVRSGIAPLMLPDVPLLPPLTEEDEVARK